MPAPLREANRRAIDDHHSETNPPLGLVRIKHHPGPTAAFLLTKDNPIQEPDLIIEGFCAVAVGGEDHVQ